MLFCKCNATNTCVRFYWSLNALDIKKSLI
jgi:hypothetical protein